MLYAVIMRYDSLRKIEAAMTAEVWKPHRLGLKKVSNSSFMSDATSRHTDKFFEEVYLDLYPRN